MADAHSIVEAWYEAYNGGDIDSGLELLSEDATTVAPGAPPMTGREEYRAFVQVFKTAAPDSRVHAGKWIEGDDAVVAEGRFTGTHTGPLASPMGEIPATNKAFDLGFADLFWLRDGKIAEHHIYFDTSDLMNQLGLMPGA